jgi:hypothetical protein
MTEWLEQSTRYKTYTSGFNGTETGEHSNLFQNVTGYGGSGNPNYNYFVNSTLNSAGYMQRVESFSSNKSGLLYYLSWAVGSPDGWCATLTALHSGNTSSIVGDMGALVSGTLKIDGFSAGVGGGKYNSYVVVSTSADYVHWNPLYSGTWTPSTTNLPQWITIGSVSNVRYIKVLVQYYNGQSAEVLVDSVKIS